ncbi:Ig-like domain-containing protein [Vallitalea sp.]|jgi:hypothetical protein|uniref:Ig-like domain-containing protein n=1 Tax=Vallitalea sp. TaxID=1882829 RepID=UPI0025F345D9|nr:Ig-like domain-containing protein [Vallitalea sp.]MCT4686842.1 Ig-like domain-containing protein [Vallitalea sp.]
MKKIRNLVLFFAMIMVLSGVNVYAASVGDSLTSPEEGWKRYDDSAEMISYKNITKANNSGLYYNSTYHYTGNSTDVKIKFDFIGSKIRIIGVLHEDYTRNISIKIDGIEYHYNQGATNHNNDYQHIQFEKQDLVNKEHTVEIAPQDSKRFSIDAIDIDENGELLPFQFSDIPLNLTAVPSNPNITLNWDVVDGADNYTILRSTTSSAVDTVIASNITETTYIDANVEPGVTYYYVVRAVKDGAESPNSSEVSAIIKASDKKVKLVLEVNRQKQLSVTDDLTDNIEMTWTSSDMTIATVDANGKVKALKLGDTVITCTNKDGSYTETINVLVVDLDLQLAVDLNTGEKCRLVVGNLMNTLKVTWKTDDSTIATVSAKGKVTAISEGLTYISALDETGKELGRIYVRVR